jgi:hypothetical protein
MLAVAGLLAIAGTGAFAVSASHTASSISPTPHWGLYSTTTWNALATRVERRGFVRESIHVDTGTKLMRNGQAFALLGARSESGRNCFVVARGAALGPTICKLSKPLTVFSESDLCACSPTGSPAKILTVLALVRPDVTSVTTIDGGRESGVGRAPVEGGASAFNASVVQGGAVLRARGATNAIVASVRLRLP